MSTQIINLGTGRCSDFGGPNDGGVGPEEGLALVEVDDFAEHWFGRNFLPLQQGVGLARSLNPSAYYCAMRWAFARFEGQQGEILFGKTREQIRRIIIKATAANGNFVFLQPLDFGPGPRTGRLIDISPGGMAHLGINTDDLVSVEAIV